MGARDGVAGTARVRASATPWRTASTPTPRDAVGAAIARVTAADVQRVAKKYFQRFDVALVMPRASEN